MSDTDSQHRLLHLLTEQNVVIANLLKAQNETMERMREEQKAFNTKLVDIVTAVKTLEANSIMDHDDQPFPVHKLQVYEPAWRAVYETLTTKMKDRVERWRNGMDSTLIFVALFVTVITSFQNPVSQNLSPNPADLTNNILNNLTTIVYEIAVLNGLNVPGHLSQPEPFQSSLSDEIVTFLFYSALLLSLITAIFSVFGRQWVENLTKKPEGQSYKDKSQRLESREKLAERLLRPILDRLHPILILSIILFIVGLLYQIWATSFSAGRSPVLLLTSAFGTVLMLGAAIVAVYTIVQGLRQEESPFTTSIPLDFCRRLLPKSFFLDVKRPIDLAPLFCSTVMQMSETHHFDQISTILFDDLLSQRNIQSAQLAINTIVFVLESDASLKAKHTLVWNMCRMWWISDDEEDIDHGTAIACYRRARYALQAAESDTPPSQEKIKLVFFMARILLFLRLNGKDAILNSLETKDLKPVFLLILILNPENCIDRTFLKYVKVDALRKCRKLETEGRCLFDNMTDDYIYDFLNAIIREDVNEDWKEFIIPHLQEKDVTNLLLRIAEESLEGDVDRHHLMFILHLTICNSRLPIVFPDKFDLSNLIEFVTYNEDRLVDYFRTWLASNCIVDTLLMCLTIMDNDLLSYQQGVAHFLESLHGLKPERDIIRDEIPAANVNALRNRVALTALPVGVLDNLEPDEEQHCSEQVYYPAIHPCSCTQVKTAKHSIGCS